MKKVAIIGTKGVPAQYGGFETLVEHLIAEKVTQDNEFTVFCSSKDYGNKITEYKGAKLRYIPYFYANGYQSVFYDTLSFMKVIRGYDAVLVLGVSGCLFLPIFRLFNRKLLVINIDGIEYKRAKWGRCVQRFLHLLEKLAVRYADIVVADNKAIYDYVKLTYNKEAALIAYGGDHAIRKVEKSFEQSVLDQYGLVPKSYSLSICRIEKENNCNITLNTFAETGKKLVFVGNWRHNDYSRQLYEKYKDLSNIVLLNSIYDLDVLYVLRANAALYVHGHSAGGSNPSLIEAMHFDLPILAFDVVYNRYTTNNFAYYYKDAEELKKMITDGTLSSTKTKQYAQEHYVWSKIAAQYDELHV